MQLLRMDSECLLYLKSFFFGIIFSFKNIAIISSSVNLFVLCVTICQIEEFCECISDCLVQFMPDLCGYLIIYEHSKREIEKKMLER